MTLSSPLVFSAKYMEAVTLLPQEQHSLSSLST